MWCVCWGVGGYVHTQVSVSDRRAGETGGTGSGGNRRGCLSDPGKDHQQVDFPGVFTTLSCITRHSLPCVSV